MLASLHAILHAILHFMMHFIIIFRDVHAQEVMSPIALCRQSFEPLWRMLQEFTNCHFDLNRLDFLWPTEQQTSGIQKIFNKYMIATLLIKPARAVRCNTCRNL